MNGDDTIEQRLCIASSPKRNPPTDSRPFRAGKIIFVTHLTARRRMYYNPELLPDASQLKRFASGVARFSERISDP